ncbi:hypothetical protein [Angustibacter speluncae]
MGTSTNAAPPTASDRTGSTEPPATEAGLGASAAPDAAVSDPIDLIEALTDPSAMAYEGCEGTPPVVWAMADFYAGHAGVTATEMRVELARTCGLPADHFENRSAAELELSEAELTQFLTAWAAANG